MNIRRILVSTLAALSVAITGIGMSTGTAHADSANVVKSGLSIHVDNDNDGNTDGRCTLGGVVIYKGIPSAFTARHCFEGIGETVYAKNLYGEWFTVGRSSVIWRNFDLALIDLSQGDSLTYYTTQIANLNRVPGNFTIRKTGATTGTTDGYIEPNALHDLKPSYTAEDQMDLDAKGYNDYGWNATLYCQGGDSGSAVYFTDGPYAGMAFAILVGGNGTGSRGSTTLAPLSLLWDQIPQ